MRGVPGDAGKHPSLELMVQTMFCPLQKDGLASERLLCHSSVGSVVW